MSELKLKALLKTAGANQNDLAVALGLSPATVAQFINHNAWPKSLDELDIKERICDFLEARGVMGEELVDAFDEKTGEPPSKTTHPVSRTAPINTHEEDSMLLRKQALSPKARQAFGLFRDPFADEAIQSHEDVFLSPSLRYVREAMWATAKHGGLLAVVGESGSGKTTLLRDLEDRIGRENQSIIVIKPYMLGAEDSDSRGKTLKASHIAEAIMATVAPLERPKSSPEARFAQLHRVLRESFAAGSRHCLVIDEAHALSVPTLKHLKRFFELELGFKKLLSIILIGQPELKAKLSERNQEVREVVQRCELVELAPLGEAALGEFLKFKFARVNKASAEVIDAAGIEALRGELTFTPARRDVSETVSLLYPLAVSNALVRCMNTAASIGAPIVTADVVRSVR
ncbi:MAG: AAA family ATPase [Burkholderiaceae bacterium]